MGFNGCGASYGADFTFTQPGLPALSIRLGVRLNGTDTVILSWPNPSTGYVLQQSPNMNAPGEGWEDVPQPPVVVGSNKEVTLLAAGQFCLFRLRRL